MAAIDRSAYYWRRHRNEAVKHRLFIVGVLLIGVSAYPLILMAREIATDRAVHARYTVEPVNGAQEARIEQHLVRLEDDQPTSANPEERVEGAVRIEVDGRDVSSGANVRIRPYFQDANRYHGYVALMKILDHESGTTRIAVSQHLGPSAITDPPYRSVQRYRVLFVSSNGEVDEDVFNYDERGSPPIRARLIAPVVSHPIGYHSDLMQVWPTLWYPLLYPWLSGLIGLVLTAMGIVTMRARSRTPRQPGA